MLEGLQAKFTQHFSEAGRNQALLAITKIEAEVFIRQPAYLLELSLAQDGDRVCGSHTGLSH
jgi:hypothetical protein